MTRPSTCLCSPCERRRFARWLRATERLPEPDHLGQIPPAAERRSARLRSEINSSISERFPAGIAERLCCVVAALFENRIDDAVTDLADLVADEEESQRLNPDQRRCPRRTT